MDIYVLILSLVDFLKWNNCPSLSNSLNSSKESSQIKSLTRPQCSINHCRSMGRTTVLCPHYTPLLQTSCCLLFCPSLSLSLVTTSLMYLPLSLSLLYPCFSLSLSRNRVSPSLSRTCLFRSLSLVPVSLPLSLVTTSLPFYLVPASHPFWYTCLSLSLVWGLQTKSTFSAYKIVFIFVSIGTEPSTYSEGMFSWFPIFFPLKVSITQTL